MNNSELICIYKTKIVHKNLFSFAFNPISNNSCDYS